MNLSKLERYSFLWSEIRLLFGAVALFLGGIPVVRYLIQTPSLYGLVGTLLTLSWIASGVASAYLLWRWVVGGKMLFGKKEKLDMVAFLVSVVSGINLGLTGLMGTNIGMSILSGYGIFALTALVYLATAYYLFSRWKKSGEKLFQ